MQGQCWLGIETGGTKILARIVQGDKVLLEDRWPTTSPQEAADVLCDFAARSPAPVAGAGIAAFGPIVVNPAAINYGEVLATPKPGWTGANLRLALSSRLGVAVEVDTDVNAAALAEQQTGAGKGCPSLAYVTIGTGIGAGLARTGRTLTGALHPEMGHVPVLKVSSDAAPSTCPFHASCAEGMAAGPAVQARLAGRDLEDVPEAFAAVADYLGQLFATIVLAWSPHRIVAGGGVLGVPGLRDAAKEKMARALGGYGVGAAAQGADFLVAPQLAHAGLEGALIIARQAVDRVD
ncbi:MAG: ROK family protein [Alphaproteobacteria bacterium]|uniref:Putative ROK family transcriptional regulator n=1 Tax=viral metagenome TaxID=1070528 RepID=A0A6H1ZMY3_9ZZZZ|nr:ROK family protein [Alphaproteobacteria bacterium]MBU2342131.1 ROK family protein [Alphaproteobacteria bacterium]